MHSANPVPHAEQTDPDEFVVVLSLITDRRTAAATAPVRRPVRDRRKLEPPRHPRRRRATAFAAAALVILAAVGVAALVLSQQGEPVAPPVTTTPVTAPPVTAPPATEPPVTATTEASPESASVGIEAPQAPTLPPASPDDEVERSPEEVMALADDYYEALNAGDVDRAAKLGPMDRDRRTAVAAFSAVFEWDCRVETEEDVFGPPTYAIVCHERVLDTFFMPAGLVHEGTITYQIVEGRLEGGGGGCFASTEPPGEFLPYVQAFDRWLYANHPGTEGWIWLFAEEGLPNWMDGRPCRMYSIESDGAGPVIAGFVREFVAQSDDYPLEPIDPVAMVEAYYAEIASGNWDVARRAHAREENPMYLEQAIAFNAAIEHECRLVPPGPTGNSTRVECDETLHDDFYGPGGITRQSTLTYIVMGGSVTAVSGRACWIGEPAQLAGPYIFEFQQWRRAEGLPEVPGMIELVDATQAAIPCSPYPFHGVPTEETVELLSEQLAAFVAASPDWPLRD
jgi:hypothetical protein